MSNPESPQAGARRAAARTLEPRRTGERLVALLVFGGVLLNFPLLSLLRGRGPVAGLPALFVYLFVVWVVLAAGTALVLRRRPPAAPDPGDEAGPREP